MNKRTKLLALFVLPALIFFAGYRLGIAKNNEYTMAVMVDLSNQIMATKAADRIYEFGNMKLTAGNNSQLICQMKNSVQQISEDWKICMDNIRCSKKLEDDKLNVFKIIKEFNGENCP